MRRIIAVILLIIGACLLILDYRQQLNSKEGLEETNTQITHSSATANSVEKRTIHFTPTVSRAEFHPQNDLIGTLEIPKLKVKLPIIEGTSERCSLDGAYISQVRHTPWTMNKNCCRDIRIPLFEIVTNCL